MNFKSKQELVDWAMSQRVSGIGVLMKAGLSFHDSEDVFLTTVEKLMGDFEKGRIPDDVELGFLIHCLRQRRYDLFRVRTTERRGGGIPHVSWDALESFEREIAFGAGARGLEASEDHAELMIPLLQRVSARVKGRKRILAEVWQRALFSGAEYIGITDWFTADERRLFEFPQRCMKDDKFRKQVQRTQSELVREIRKLVQLN